MARASNRLTVLGLKRDLEPGLYADGDGLYLQVSRQRTKAWVFRFMRAGQARKMGLGPVSTRPDDKRISLADARQKAADARSLLLDGIDPIIAREQRRAAVALQEARAITFKLASEQYIDDNAVAWRNEKHRDQWQSTLVTYAHPVIGAVSVGDVDTGLVLKILRPIWSEKPETASRVRGRIESILDWCKTQGYRDGENPARWRGHLENVLPPKSEVATVEHHRALPYADLPAFMVELRNREGTSARALEFTILTAARTNETIGAMPGELDPVNKVWIVPPGRMKGRKGNQRQHRVPLSARAIDIIEAMRSNHRYVFPGQKQDRPLSNMAMLELLRGMRGDGLTVHGFRSTFKDWCAETTSYPNELSEVALSHKVPDKVEAAYRRGDMFEKRRQLMADWAAFCFGEQSE
jgi:integrase